MSALAERLRIHIVDDDASVLDSLRALLVAHGYDVVAHLSAEDFLESHRSMAAACLLLDIRMQGMGGMELIDHMQQRGIRVPTIILTGHGDVPLAVQAMKKGAIDFIEKPGSEAQILEAIAHAAGHIGNPAVGTMNQDVIAERMGKLTLREREVLDHLVLGETNKQIADRLGISQRTVEIHRARIREKLEARGLADLIRMTARQGAG